MIINLTEEQQKIGEFLIESNAIENVRDNDSLVQAFTAWEYLVTEEEMSPGVVLKTHKTLMLHQPLRPNEKGYFRDIMVCVGGKPCLNAVKIREEIEHWCKEMNLKTRLSESKSKALHVKYEKIHPFVDGNGRTGRMFMNWWRIKNGLPILVIHEGDEQLEYYQWFK